MVQFFDTLILDGVRKTKDGYLTGMAKSARTGIQVYNARELGLTDRDPFDQIRVYRSPEQVFSRDSLASMAYRPVTLDHPPEMVDSKNWKTYSVGTVGSEILRDGEAVKVPMVLMDQAAIDRWEGGARQLSWGYTSELEFRDGVTPDGEAFDAEMVGISTNHLAMLQAGRAGPDFRLGDRQPENGGRTVALKTIFVDGLPVETTEAGEHAINKLKGLLDAAGKSLTDAQAGHVVAIAAKDTEIGTLTAKLADAEAKAVTGAALDALVTDRAAVVAKAKALGLQDAAIAGKTNDEIKAAAVALKFGDAAVAGKSAEYTGALFDHAPGSTQANPVDPLRRALIDAQPAPDDAKAFADARRARFAYLADAHSAPAQDAA